MAEERPESAEPRSRDDGLPSPGTVIGEYTISKPIGVGGCGAVFQAFHERLDRTVAIKVLLPDAADRFDGLAKRFLREIDIVKRLEHPNIVRMYDYGQTDSNLLWMAMELVRGEELATVLSETSLLPAPRVKHIMLQTLSALAEAHELNIVHRDLKPGNIMLTRKGADEDVVKLLDFGIGKALGEGENSAVHNLTTAQGDAYGTPRYMAPELLLKEDIGPHSDVYSIGLILYECIVGQPAVVGETIYEILAHQLSKPIEMPSEVANSPIGKVIAKATAKDWSARFPTALEFHRALRAADVGGEPVGTASGYPGQDPVTTQRTPATMSGAAPDTGQVPMTDPTPVPAPSPMAPAAGGGPVQSNMSATSSGPMRPVDRPAVSPAVPNVPGLPQPGASPPASPATPPSQPQPASSPPQTSGIPPAVTPGDEDDLRALMGSNATKKRNVMLGIGAGAFLAIFLIVWLVVGGEEETPPDASAAPDETEESSDGPAEDQQEEATFEMVEWSFESTPAGAEVQVNGRRVCSATPCTAEIRKLDRGVVVIMTKPGYRAVSRTIVPTQPNAEIAVEMQELLDPSERVASPPTPKKEGEGEDGDESGDE